MQPEQSVKGLYDTDFAAWARQNASLLREGAELDEEQLEALLSQSPSLRKSLEQDLPQFYDRAKRRARMETGSGDFPLENPFTVDQILNG